jgi:prolyl oligopeptidase
MTHLPWIGRVGLVIALVGAPAALAQAPATAPAAPPVTPPGEVRDTLFGTAVPDPYRHLEDLKSPATQAWMRGQAAFAEATLARIPGRAALRAQLAAADAAVPATVMQVMRESEARWFYLKRGTGDQAFKLVVRRMLEGVEQVLVDPDALARGARVPQAINYYAPAPGGRWVAYGISQGGSEDAVLRVVGTGSGKHYGEPIDRAEIGGIGWSADGRTLFFNRLQALPPGADPGRKYLDSQAWMWRPGAPLASAKPVFGNGLPGVKLDPVDVPAVSITHDGRWAIGEVARGTQNEIGLWVSDAASVLAGAPRWRLLVDMAAEVVAWGYKDGALVLLSHKDAPRRKVLALPVAATGIEAAREIVPAGEQVITGLAVAADALYLRLREGNATRLHKRAWSAPAGAPAVPVPLPVQGSFQLNGGEGGPGAANPRLPGLVLDLQGWTRARQTWLLRADGSTRNTGLQPAGPRDAPDDIAATEVLVPSHDGARVPMAIIHRKDIALNGTHPVLLMGYAAYGSTLEPAFHRDHRVWLDAGGVIAVANPRGSGAFGDDWYLAGKGAAKPNSWKDFIACAQWLIDGGWTRPARLGILGGSAGGILVGRALTERPELFAAVVSEVGSMDMLRSEFSPNGAPNIPEFGSQATEAGFRALLAMSPYHHMKDGVKYPAVLFLHGMNDPRVDVWESAKAAARLQAVAAGVPGSRPVLLRLDDDAGHGIGSSLAQQQAETADIYAFLLWQMGIEGYQPK